MNPANYFFRLDQFHIDNTRAPDEDTDVVSIAVKLDGKLIGPEIAHVGDVDNGDHPVNLELGPIFVDNPSSNLEFNFQIVNSGNQNDSEIRAALEKGADALLAEAFSRGNFWAIAGAGAIRLLTGLFNFDCDGPVAVDAFGFTGAELDRLTSETSVSTTTKFYPGVDSDIGCGSNSRYTVTWSIFRVDAIPASPAFPGVSVVKFPKLTPQGRVL